MKSPYREKYWRCSVDVLEREVRRLQNIVKHPGSYASSTVKDANSRLPALKSILGARKGTLPMFPKGTV